MCPVKRVQKLLLFSAKLRGYVRYKHKHKVADKD